MGAWIQDGEGEQVNYENEYDNTLPTGVKPDKPKGTVVWQILFYLALTLLCFSVTGTAVTAMLGLYSHTAVDSIEYQRVRITSQKCVRVLNEYAAYADGVDFYDLSGDYRGITNFRYRIYSLREDGVTIPLAGNYDGGDYEATAESIGTYSTAEPYIFSSPMETTGTDAQTDTAAETTVPDEETPEIALLQSEQRLIRGYYCPQPGVVDLYTVMDEATRFCDTLQYVFPLGILLFAAVCVILGTILTRKLWLLSAYGGPMLLARIPFDLTAVGVFLILSFTDCIVRTAAISFRVSLPNLWAVGILLLCLLGLPFLFVLFYSALVVQIERRCFFATMVAVRIVTGILLPVLRWFGSGLARFFGMIPFAWRTAIFVPIVGIVILFLSVGAQTGSPLAFLLLLSCCLIVYVVCLYAAYAIRVLQKSGEELSRGNLSYKTDTRHLHSVFRELAENLNAIGEGMEAAIAEKMKSEHFKTELITNVSHDIKTPLTSIINYTDLLSKEELSGKAREYTEILSRQSARLKKLTEDLVEASKATTGNLPCNPERLSVCQIVRQSLGEYEERLESAGLQVRETIPEDDLYAMVDGRLLWRVLENLYSNATKYALPGTRVYLVVTEDNGSVCISMKNISREPLSVTGEDLTERFVKGDASRSSEGSGLGLNIAKSLVELQHGTFRVTCDGDLFRCDIVFPLAA